MRSLILPELSTDLGLSAKSCIRRRIGEIFPEVWRGHGVSEKIPKLEDYANRLRDEMKKIDAFKRELPLCMILLRDAIVAAEEELGQCKKSNIKPVLEEFIPVKRICKDEAMKAESHPVREEDSCKEKMNWMSSVQLWNSTTHPSPDPDYNNDKPTLKLDTIKKKTEEEMNRNKTVVPLMGCSGFPLLSIGKEENHQMPISALSLCIPEMRSLKEGVNPVVFSSKSCSSGSESHPPANVRSNLMTAQQHQSSRKQRRCWSPDLHRQFINALHQLGGAHAATPKQIRELMRVDGLTNDEVKSHLQKYRLHSRRLSRNLSSQSVSLLMLEEHCTESLKPSQSGSPDGPFHWGGNEVEDDEKHELSSYFTGRH